MASKKIQLYTDRANTIEASPETSANCVILSDGNDLQKVLDNDLTTPTVVHEETSFKVGVGDVNVSSSVVDGEVGRMVIKGKTYQNILPEPSTPVLTNNKEMFKVNEGLYPNVEVVDGISKSAILKGNTLLVDELGNECEIPNSPKITMGAWINTNTGVETASVTSFNTGFLKCPTVPFVVKGNNKYKRIVFYDENKTFISGIDTKVSNNSDVTIASTKIPSNAFYLRISASSNTEGVSYTPDTKLLIEDVSGNNLYSTQLVSVKMPVLKTTGKNLFDPYSPFDTDYYGSEGWCLSCHYDHEKKLIITEGVSGQKNSQFPFLKFKPNTTYTFSGNVVGHQQRFCIHNESKQIEFNGTGHFSLTATTGDNGKLYVSILKVGTPNGVYGIENLQIKEGSTATSYEPHKSNILSCQLAPLNQSMFEQGTFAESTPPNTQSYESIKLGSEHLYTTRIRTKGTYKVVQGATYEVQLNDGYGIFICYCKNGLYSATINRWLDGTRFTFTVPNDCDEMFFAIRKTDNSAITPSDYPLIGLKIHQEVVLRSLPNGVKDTLNLNTGEYVQRIGEIVLDGSQSLVLGGQDSKKVVQFIWASTDVAKNTNDEVKVRANYLSAYVPSEVIDQSIEGICTRRNDNQGLYIALSKTKVATRDINLVKEYLQANPITAYYELATPVVKTVDLSSSGNWEKIVLDGSSDELWRFREKWREDGTLCFSIPMPEDMKHNGMNQMIGIMSDKFKPGFMKENSIFTGYLNERVICLCFNPTVVSSDLDSVRAWLSQNPVTVWYQTTNHQDSTQVKQPIFFKDGHIQLSSGADNSLIPTLDYQVKTSNSYVVDLMKSNTQYTMKAKSASGTFTIDGVSYSAGTNGTFTSPSSMTNKLLVVSNKTNTEVMILEGDVTSKTIPYFKGIKSAFEDESKIEVLSTGKNLFDGVFEQGYLRDATGQPVDNNQKNLEGVHSANYIPIKEKTIYSLSVVLGSEYNGYNTSFYFYDENKNYLGYVANANKARSKENAKYMRFRIFKNGGSITKEHCNSDLNVKFQVEEGSVITTHEPYRSNNTKIPLLSPLRSLPNGVCDELIIDRMKKKATLIKRLDCITFDGSSDENWHSWGINNSVTHLNSYHYVDGTNNTKNLKVKANPSWFTSRLGYGGGYTSNKTGASLNNSYFAFSIPKNLIGAGGGDTTTMCEKNARKWLSQNPVTVYYELATPVVTEIDLESFPLVYKDGHIFLNSEIAPVVEIDYNVNQAQQIQANNETLQRHELDILDLDNLIVSFVNAEYKLRLLKFNMELSMMALAE